MYKYVVRWSVGGERHSYENNDRDCALNYFWRAMRMGYNVDISSGITGEIFAYRYEDDSYYVAPEWSAVMIDYLMRNAWGE